MPRIPLLPYALLGLLAAVGGVWACVRLGIDTVRRLESVLRERTRHLDNMFEYSDRRKRS